MSALSLEVTFNREGSGVPKKVEMDVDLSWLKFCIFGEMDENCKFPKIGPILTNEVKWIEVVRQLLGEGP